MKPAVASILIAGAGQLGSRYLQGLAKCRLPLMIYVQDIREASLVRAKQRWDEVHGPETRHVVSFHASFETLPRQCDIAIVATTADVRPRVIAEIADHSAVRFWILEKVLAQSESDLDEIRAHIGIGSNAWVNTLRRMLPWHQQLKSQLDLKPPLILKVDGGKWGWPATPFIFSICLPGGPVKHSRKSIPTASTNAGLRENGKVTGRCWEHWAQGFPGDPRRCSAPERARLVIQ